MRKSRSLIPVLAASMVALAATATVAQEAFPQLAQRDIDIYFDDAGNRILVDPYTGQVIAVQPPRRVDRRATGAIARERPRERERRRDNDRYYLDDPEDMARLRRDRQRRGDVRDLAPTIRQEELDDFFPEEDTASVEREERTIRRREPVIAREEPAVRRREAPAAEFPTAPRETPRFTERKPVQRAPIEAPAVESEQAAVQPQPAPAEPALSPADPNDVPTIGGKGDTKIAKLQILLDRAGASPGVIDGRTGENVTKALVAYDELGGAPIDRENEAAIDAALEASGGPAFTSYTISPEDAAGPYVASVPEDYSEKAQLERLSYTSVAEMLAERFHMDERYLREINPEANFDRPGTVIQVASVGRPVAKQVARIEADKARKQVRAYDADGALVVAYPATIGSEDTPSPSGTVQVERVAFNPEYTYNPKINFKQGENDQILRIPPGPNGPVGSIWIALSKPTYGIHGTPEPSKIGKTNSHGCVRLTNWDAQELAKMVSKGVTVEFTE